MPSIPQTLSKIKPYNLICNIVPARLSPMYYTANTVGFGIQSKIA